MKKILFAVLLMTGVAVAQGSGGGQSGTGGGGGSGTVTSVTAGTGLTGGTFTTSGTIALSTPVSVANGGTALTTGTSGGILCYTATGTLASSSLLTLNQVLLGGGASACPTPDSTLSDNGTTLTYSGTGGFTASQGPFTSTSDGVHSAALILVGNTTPPTALGSAANSVGWLGPNSASFTKYFLQLPATAPSGGQVLSCGTPSSSVSACTWGSGGGGGALSAVTGSAAQATGTEVAAGDQYTFAGVETAALTYPFSITNTSASNNSSGALVVGTTGTGTSQVPLVVAEDGSGTNVGDLTDWYLGSTVTNGVVSGGTKTAWITVKGAGSFGSTAPAPTLGTSGGSIAVCGTAFTGIASDAGWYCNASNFVDLITATTDLGPAVAESTIIGANVITKGIGTNPGIAASSITDAGTTVSFAEGLAFSGASGAATTISTTTANANVILAPNGTGSVVVPVGAAATPSLQASGSATNTGLFFPATTTFCLDSAGVIKDCVFASGFEVADVNSYVFSQTAAGNGAAGPNLGVVGTGTTETINPSTILLLPQCKITSAVTLSGTTAVVCTWTLPNSAQTWAWQCHGSYSITAGTTPGLTLQMNAAQAPTSETGNGIIGSLTASSSSTQTFQTGSNTSTSAGAQTIFASTPTVAITTLTNAPWSTSGTVQASATSGTFAIQAVLSGTGTPAGTISVGSTCQIY